MFQNPIPFKKKIKGSKGFDFKRPVDSLWKIY